MKKIFGAYLGLLFLLALTLLAHRLALGNLATPVALAIAALKTALVAWIFMELGKSSPASRLMAGAGVLWIFFFYFLSALDVFFRPGTPEIWYK
jgi:cytochrome c oxidase subunit 4